MAHEYQLIHPENDMPAEAIQLGYMTDANGRAIGLVLRFPDGDRALTYAEITHLRGALAAQRATARAQAFAEAAH